MAFLLPPATISRHSTPSIVAIAQEPCRAKFSDSVRLYRYLTAKPAFAPAFAIDGTRSDRNVSCE